MRKIMVLLILFAGSVVIFPSFRSGTFLSSALFMKARPSDQPLPTAWQNKQGFQVAGAGAAAGAGPNSSTAGSSVNENCGDPYLIHPGETLGKIAKKCGVSLAKLLAANPNIQNPNKIYAGQKINVPDSMTGRGGGDPLSASEPAQPGGFQPGASLTIRVNGLPSNNMVRVGLGLSSSGYRALAKKQTDEHGNITLRLTLPGDAKPGETAFILFTTESVPAVQRMSEPFVIGTP